MASTRIKICGITRAEHAIAAAEAGTDYLGFVFAPSKRQVSAEHAAGILATARAIVPMPPTVGVFVDESAEQIALIVHIADLNYVQLSGTNSAEECSRIRELAGVSVIKAIHVAGADDLQRMEEYAGCVDYFLLDTAVKGNYGGTGQVFDWRLFEEASARAGAIPIFLAGGLHAGNVAEAIRSARPYAVDVSSGVETAGSKDSAKIRAFIAATRAVAG